MSNFAEIQFESNRGFLLLRSLSHYKPPELEGVDSQLLHLLLQLPSLTKLELPIPESLEKSINAILSFKLCGGQSTGFEYLFGCNPQVIQPTLASHACGYVFKKGDGVYRCIDCALDDTCVLCAKCFRSSDHSGHSTSFYYSSGMGGCCDCGDAEAWKVPGTCTIHCQTTEMSSENDSQPLSKELVESIRTTIVTVFEMIISTIDAIKPDFGQPFDIAAIRNSSSLDNDTEEAREYGLVVWNDESHSFDEVIVTLAAAVGCSTQEASQYAKYIDNYGRQVVKSSTNIPRLIVMANEIVATGLIVTIRPLKDIFRETLAGYLLEWIISLPDKVVGKQIVNGISMESVSALMRIIICEELDKSSLIIPQVTESNTDPLKSSRIEHFLLFDNRLWKKFRSSLKELIIGTLIVQGDEYKRKLAYYYSRQYLTMNRGYLLDDSEYELSIASLSVQLFTVPTIVRYLSENTDLITDLLVLLKLFFIQDIFPESISISTNYQSSLAFARNHILPIYPAHDINSANMGSNKPLHFFADLNYLLVAKHNSGPGCYLNHLPKGNQPSELSRFIDLCTVFQGIHPQVRALLVHVEFEVEMNQWINQFNISHNLMRMIREIVQGYFTDSKVQDYTQCNLLIYAVSLVRDAIFSWSLNELFRTLSGARRSQIEIGATGFHTVDLIPGNFIRVPDRRIATVHVSLHHSLHWFMTSLLVKLAEVAKHTNSMPLIEKINHELFSCSSPAQSQMMEVQDTFTSIEELSLCLSELDRQLLLYDYAFQTVAFVSQVRAKIWIRNGDSMRAQALYYRDLSLRDCYDRDIYLLQYAAIKFGGDTFLTQLVDRFDLVDFFRGQIVSSRPHSFTLEQTTSLVEDLLQILIVVLTEPSFLMAYSWNDKLRLEVLHQLAAQPSGIAFSVLSKKVATILEGSTADKLKLDDLLSELATFKYPFGYTDNGLYSLKDEFYSDVNIWYWHYTRNQREEIEETLKSRLKKKQALSPSTLTDKERLNLPQILKTEKSEFNTIGQLILSKAFVQMLLNALWNITRDLLTKAKPSVSSYTILSEIIYLLLIGVEYVKSNPIAYESFLTNLKAQKINVLIAESYHDVCLLELILCLIDRANEDDIKDQAARLKYIVKTVESLNSDVQSIISGWRDKSNWKLFYSGAPVVGNDQSGLTEAQKKKAASKARQAAIMAQFAQAQSSFIANYEDEMDDIDDELETKDEPINDVEMEVDEKGYRFPTGQCIVCQEDACSGEQPYGLLVLIQPTAIRRQVDFRDESNLIRVINSPLTYDNEIERESFTPVTSSSIPLLRDDPEFFAHHSAKEKNGTAVTTPGLTTTTCGHLMHLNCFEGYRASIQPRHNLQPLRNHPENLAFKEFICPLCKSLGNLILPIIWNKKEESINNGEFTKEKTDAELMDGLRDYIVTDIAGLCVPQTKPVRRPSIVIGSTNDESIIEEERYSLPRSGGSSDPNSFSLPRMAGAFPKEDEKSLKMKSLVTSSMSSLYNELTDLSGNNSTPHIRNVIDSYENYLFANIRMFNMPNIYRSQPESGIKPLLQVWDLLNTTICSIEIMARGAPLNSNNYRFTKVIDQVNPTQLELLRVLSESCLSSMVTKKNFNLLLIDNFIAEFFSVLLNDSSRANLPKVESPLLLRDGFTHLLHVSMTIIPLFSLHEPDHIFYWIRLFTVFEIVRTIATVLESLFLEGKFWMKRYESNNASKKQFPTGKGSTLNSSLLQLIHHIALKMNIGSVWDLLFHLISERLVAGLIESNLLIYFRKCVLLLYAKFGVVPPSENEESGVESITELDRLRQYLYLPPIDKIYEAVQVDFFKDLTATWCEHLFKQNPQYWLNLCEKLQAPNALVTTLPLLRIDQPTQFELIKLPIRLETLFEEALKRTCDNCKTVPEDPAICLLCGMFVCSQSFCCSEDNRGECNLHSDICGSKTGIFLSLKKCSILFLHKGQGCFINPPYLDSHGEVDLGLRRGRPLFLNQRRYDEVRRCWLSHSIPSFIGRKLEMGLDGGGWRTL
ncbi:hypothetical protein BC833DRAFT_620830 [Globomyces pollinis-pini]|nr:hypothetical protein BC833DRAFT_620830 [Globomyces pollinis-pini]